VRVGKLADVGQGLFCSPSGRLEVERVSVFDVVDEARSDFESDHEGPFERLKGPMGRDRDEYKDPAVQREYMIWLRARASVRSCHCCGGVVAQ